MAEPESLESAQAKVIASIEDLVIFMESLRKESENTNQDKNLDKIKTAFENTGKTLKRSCCRG